MSHIPVLALIPEEKTAQEIHRSVSLSNQDWLILSQCAEAFSTTFRAETSQFIATYVTRGQLDLAVREAEKMNVLLQKLDEIHVALLS